LPVFSPFFLKPFCLSTWRSFLESIDHWRIRGGVFHFDGMTVIFFRLPSNLLWRRKIFTSGAGLGESSHGSVELRRGTLEEVYSFFLFYREARPLFFGFFPAAANPPATKIFSLPESPSPVPFPRPQFNPPALFSPYRRVISPPPLRLPSEDANLLRTGLPLRWRACLLSKNM